MYGDFIARELDDLRAVKASMEQRAVAVITTSGVLVTLLFGLAVLVTGRDDFELPGAAKPFLVAALAGFLLAAILALAVNLPSSHDAPTADGLKQVYLHQWHDKAWVARRRVAVTRVAVISSYQRRNEKRAFFLRLAIAAECLAVAAVAIAVAIVLVK